MPTLKEIAQQAWIQIRDEQEKRANTAQRVGSAGLSIINLIESLEQDGLTEAEIEALILSFFVTSATPSPTYDNNFRTIRQDGDFNFTEGYHVKRFTITGATAIKINGVAPAGGALAVMLDEVYTNVYNSVLPVLEFNANNTYTDYTVVVPAGIDAIYICGTTAHPALCVTITEKYVTRSKYDTDVISLQNKLNEVEQIAIAAL